MQILVFKKLSQLLHCLLSLYPPWPQCLSIGASVLGSLWRPAPVPSINLYNSLAYLRTVKITTNRLLKGKFVLFEKISVYDAYFMRIETNIFNALFTNNKWSNSKVFSSCDDVKLVWCRICTNFQMGSILHFYILITKPHNINLPSI